MINAAADSKLSDKDLDSKLSDKGLDEDLVAILL